ncbi:glycosyltransferase family 2 protein [Reichenbachiella versicolor]|uniref:glycosyltransferase family 2 protein n=1 Tax=Reichenbachiella versicolor TaxID=1821036 RepID=UPI000D6E887F|nr:glycosyltransferase family 2 protein [Reichenbachiella versicolor]
MTSLVSVIMPAYNSESFIEEAIESVFLQTHENWELLIVNDGSIDNTEKIVLSFKDSRVRYFSQQNKGVGAARNLGLKQMRGDYFCFLDADDILPKRAIQARLDVFLTNDEIAFVSGKVVQMDQVLNKVLLTQVPTYRGMPQKEIIRLSSSCLVTINWLIKREVDIDYMFPTGWTHSEDIAFFLSISEAGLYDFTEEEVLIYRRNEGSAMSNLKGLEQGYINYYRFVLENVSNLDEEDRVYLKKRIRRIMVLSYLRGFKLCDAIRCFFYLTRM